MKQSSRHARGVVAIQSLEVTEHLEGETLADRIKKGLLPPDQGR